jgi:hypothetical protein
MRAKVAILILIPTFLRIADRFCHCGTVSKAGAGAFDKLWKIKNWIWFPV